MASTDLLIRTLEEELGHFDHAVDHSTDVRTQVVNKLTGLLKHIDGVDLDDDKKFMSAMQLANTTLKAINDQETSASRRITAKIKQQDQRRADNTQTLVAELFQKMSTGTLVDGDLPIIDLPASSLDILDRFSRDGDIILDTELREDPQDLA